MPVILRRPGKVAAEPLLCASLRLARPRMDGADHCQQFRSTQAPAIQPATPLPRPESTDAHRQSRAHRRQRIRFALTFDPGVLHSASLAKYAVAFFNISTSIRSRAFSARTRDSSICSGVIALAPGGWSLPAFAAFTQLRSVCSINPNSLATAPMLWPLFTRFTANSLNSAVYSCFGILNISSPSSQLRLYPTSWKTKFRGKLTGAQAGAGVLPHTAG